MTEREWREASDMRQASVSVAAILLAAALLRFLGLGGAAVQVAQPEERATVERAVAMMRTGSLHPGSFERPPLYLYFQMGSAIARFVRGAAAGEWRSLDEVAPGAEFYRWGRTLSAALGTLTVLLVYLAGLRWGTRPALLAAGLMAVIPLHVRESQMVTTGAPLVFFVAMTLLLTLRGHETPRAGTFAAAGAAAGLAAATDYAGCVALLLPLVAIWMTPAARPSRAAAAGGALLTAAAVFVVVAPYALLDLPGFLNGLAARLARPPSPDAPRLLIFGREVLANVAWPAFLLLLGGVVFAVVRALRGPGRVRWTLALTFPAVYLWSVRPEGAGRFVVPLLPFVCLFAATAVVSGVSLLRRFAIPRALRTALIVTLTVATLLPASIASIRLTREVRATGTAAGHEQAAGAEDVDAAGTGQQPGRHASHEGTSRLRRRRGGPVRADDRADRIAAHEAAVRHLSRADHERRRDPAHPAVPGRHRALSHRRRARPRRAGRHPRSELPASGAPSWRPATTDTWPRSSSRPGPIRSRLSDTQPRPAMSETVSAP